ncbi:hypothetical protein BC351_37610 [Paenibacillus ferrarius]|uniref:SLH domain-containing protein n=1 Tax=Paenibacillus ferrarius TaxID=1469647 RepID=A0A1V4HAX2_9BACL|nr:S-layer homology domain-containing protein [Paenibacillus ferrarius]OPH49035.1 hypothetical protein BC351_37610 [Paenibacillus ferrarius]
MKRLVMKKKLSIVLIMAMMFTMMASFQYVDADAAPTVTSTPSPSATPAASPSPSPAASPAPSPAVSPAPSPAATPAASPSPSPTAKPTAPAPSPSAAPLDAQAKFAALKAKGILDGIDETGAAGLDKELTRAQLAKIIVVLSGLAEDKAASAVYTDLEGASWATGYIGAVAKAGFMDGISADQFNPAGVVSIEQVAAVFARVFKLQPDVNAAVTGTVSDWAKGSIAAAIKAGFIASVKDFTIAANRELLVNAAYTGYQLILTNGPVITITKVSVAEFKAAGAKTLLVKLNGSIADTTKLTVSVLRGGLAGSVAAGAQKWNTNKNEVTITLDAKMTENTYTVKLEAVKDGGLTVDKGTADVAVTDEKISKIAFTTASDTVAQGKIKIGFKATNQYNEVSDINATRFSIYTSPELDVIAAGDSQSLTIDVTHAVYANKLARNQTFYVGINAPEYTPQITKTFTVGDPQSVAKVELGDIAYANGKTSLEAGDTATIPFKAFDQYGFQVTDLNVLKTYAMAYTNGSGVIDTTAMSPPQGFGFVADETGDGIPELKLKAASNLTLFSDQEVTVSLSAALSGSPASKTLKVAMAKVPYEVILGAFPNTIAIGDDDVYLPITVKDKAGNLLNTDEIVNNADKILIYSYGVSAVTVGAKDAAGKVVGGIEKSGANRGKIRISDLKLVPERGSGQLTVSAKVTPSGKSTTARTSIVAKRYPNTVFLSVVPKVKMLPSIDLTDSKTENIFRLKYRDQYGEEFDRDYTGYTVQLTFNQTSGSVTDAVYFSKGGFTWKADGTPNNTAILNTTTNKTLILDGVDATRDAYNPGATEIGSYRDKDLLFTANMGDNNEGSYQLTAQLFKGDRAAVAAGNASLLSTAISSTQLIKAKESDNLTYAVTPFANGIYAVDKISGILQGGASTVVKGVYSTEGYALENLFAGKIVITAKDSGGNVVQIPNNHVKAVTSSNMQATAVVNKTKADGAVAKDFDGYAIRGKDVGTTSIAVLFKPSNYTGVKYSLMDNIAIKEEALFASSLAATFNGKPRIIWLSQLKAGVNIFTGNDTGRLNQKQTFSNITLTDQYGNNAFKNSSVIRVAPVFGIQTFISNIRWASDNIVPGSGYLAIESNISGVNNMNNQTNAVTPVPAGTDPTDWVFATVPNANPALNPIQLNRGDAKYIYVPAKSAVDGSNVEVVSFTATMITANGKMISVDVYPDAAK